MKKVIWGILGTARTISTTSATKPASAAARCTTSAVTVSSQAGSCLRVSRDGQWHWLITIPHCGRIARQARLSTSARGGSSPSPYLHNAFLINACRSAASEGASRSRFRSTHREVSTARSSVLEPCDQYILETETFSRAVRGEIYHLPYGLEDALRQVQVALKYPF